MFSSQPTFSLAIHGGAGTINRAALTPELEQGYRNGLRRALSAGHSVLADGGSAVRAVTAAVVVLEDDPLFNAGRGSVFTSSGAQEMDAAVMDGADRSAGAVAGICGPRNPVIAAEAVRAHSPHVLLAGAGALAFCREHGISFEEAGYFSTDRRQAALERELDRRRLDGPDERDDADRHGTVGAVARDREGNLAAATSTGGMTAKEPGRVGDSPVIGAGTWAENGACAVSATGTGEVFIRLGVAHEIAARMRLAGQSAEVAAAGVISELDAYGGDGGVIVVDAAGHITMPFNSQGMYRGSVDSDGQLLTGVYREPLSAA